VTYSAIQPSPPPSSTAWMHNDIVFKITDPSWLLRERNGLEITAAKPAERGLANFTDRRSKRRPYVSFR
jgi:hypothetical protein